MANDPPKKLPNPVIKKMRERVKTNDQPRPRPTYEVSRRGLAPAGSVGTEKTERQKEAERHNAKIQQKKNEENARIKAREIPGGATREFNEKSNKL